MIVDDSAGGHAHLSAPPKMASSAPFGTDLQTPTLAKIVGSKVVYISKESTVQLNTESPSRTKERSSARDTVTMPTRSSPSLLHIPASAFSRVVSDCQLHSKSSKYIEKQTLFEILINNEVEISTEQLMSLINVSGCAVDYYHVDYIEFLDILRRLSNSFEERDESDQVDNIQTLPQLSPLRLAKTCPADFLSSSRNFPPANLKSSSIRHARPNTELDTLKTLKNTCSNNGRTDGMENLINALRKCSTIRGNGCMH